MICDDCQRQGDCRYVPSENDICGNFFPRSVTEGKERINGVLPGPKTPKPNIVPPKCGDVITVNEAIRYFYPAGNAIADTATGQKHDTGKPPITLLDRDFLEGTAQVMRFGAEKYDRYNWCGGISHTRLADAAMRHLIAWASGEDIDPESGLPHIDHASASLNMLRGTQRLHPGMDDRYKKGPGRRTDG